MSRPVSDDLHVLISTMKKGEKRYFKLFVGREGDPSSMKSIQLFDIVDKQNTYNELEAMKLMGQKKVQYANLKAHLYKRVLESIRLYNRKLFEVEFIAFLPYSGVADGRPMEL